MAFLPRKVRWGLSTGATEAYAADTDTTLIADVDDVVLSKEETEKQPDYSGRPLDAGKEASITVTSKRGSNATLAAIADGQTSVFAEVAEAFVAEQKGDRFTRCTVIREKASSTAYDGNSENLDIFVFTASGPGSVIEEFTVSA